MNLTNLDLDTLRTLVTAHDLGGFAQAADRLGRTPSAISLQMKRLQDVLEVPLFRKSGRTLALTEAGHTTLDYARRILTLNDDLLHTMQGTSLAGHIRLGCPQDFAPILPGVLRLFATQYPRIQLELRIEGNGALIEALDKQHLDLALTIGFDSRTGALKLGELPVVWIAGRTFQPTQDPLPLAVLGPQCAFRKVAIQQLESTGTPHRIAATSPSLDGLWAALQGGLGITARTALNLPPNLVSGRSLHRLPPLTPMAVALHRGNAASPALDSLHALIRTAARDALSTLTPAILRTVRKA